MLISNTPPSRLASSESLLRNITTAFSSCWIMMDGELRYLSLTAAGSFTHAAFGGESAGGDGSPEFEVCQSMPSGLIPLLAVQPAGSAGGVTKSKFSNNAHPTGVDVGVAVGVAVGVGLGGLPSRKPTIWKTWSGHTWAGMQAFFRFHVM